MDGLAKGWRASSVCNASGFFVSFLVLVYVCVSSLSIGSVNCRLASGDIDYPILLLLATVSLLSGKLMRLLVEVRFLGGYMVEVM